MTTLTPPPDDDPLTTWGIAAEVTYSDLAAFPVVGDLLGLRGRLEDLGARRKATQPLPLRSAGRLAFRWREVWESEACNERDANR